MTSSATLTPRSLFSPSRPGALERQVLTLVVVWAPREPGRLGECLQLPPHPDHAGWLFGRGEPREDSPWRRLRFVRQRPGDLQSAGYPASPTLSRRQLEIRVLDDTTLSVTNVGRCALMHNGLETSEARVGPGDLLELRDQLMLLCVRRPERLDVLFPDLPLEMHPFGLVDAHGMVGESPAIWEVRQQLVRIARHAEHVLILGASGTGKELAAQALHTLSAHRDKPLVSRNAATFPETLIDAELFGNARNFPNPGMLDRPGLIGEAHGSTLFLDEIGELPLEMQPRLLRVLDRGEYQRLGDATVRRSSFRLIAATNRRATELKHDLRARLPLSLELPGLEARREDIPLLVRALLRRMAQRNPYIAQRYFEGGDARLEARISPALIRCLVQRRYATQVRELELLLFQAISRGGARDYVELGEVAADPSPTPVTDPSPTPLPADPSPNPLPVSAADPSPNPLPDAGRGLRSESSPTPLPADPSPNPLPVSAADPSPNPLPDAGRGLRRVISSPSVEAAAERLGMQDPTYRHAFDRGARRSGTSRNEGQNAPPLTGDGSGERSLSGDTHGPFPVASSGGGDLELEASPLGEEDLRRIAVFREVGFHIDAYARHPEVGRYRSTANVHLLTLLFKALCASGFRITPAVRLLAGDDAGLQRALRRRLEQHLDALSRQLEAEGEATVKARLRQRYRTESGWAERVVDALRAGQIREG